MKEALSKAHGEGLSMDVSAFEIPRHLRNGPRGGEFRFADATDAAWWLENIGTDRFAAAVAHEKDGG